MSLIRAQFANSIVYYNGVLFPSGTTETTGVSIRPQQDSSGRTTVYNVYSLSFRTVLAGGPTDSSVLAARRALTTQGGAFQYDGRGIGGLTINVGNQRDVVWGPKPKELGFRPMGGPGIACELTFSIEVAIPDCSQAKHRFAAMEFCFSPTYDVQDGYTTRRITGHLAIPMTRSAAANRTLPDSVDYYREQIAPPLVPGFRRKYGPWRINEAKTRLDFEIIDEEMGGNIPPDGCVRASMSHTVSSTQVGLLKWSGNFQADYELARDADPYNVFADTMAIIKNRVEYTIAAVNQNRFSRQLVKDSASKAIIPVSMSLGEPDIFAQRRRMTFSLGYTFVCDVRDILLGSGLYRPVPNTDWRSWSASIADSAFSPRGVAGLVFNMGDDRIIDLCDPGGGQYVPPQAEPTWRNMGSIPMPGRQYASQYTDMIRATFPRPKAEESWVYYENEFFLEADSGTVPLRLLPTQELKGAADQFAGKVREASLAGKVISRINGEKQDIVGEIWDALNTVLPTSPNTAPATTAPPASSPAANKDTTIQRRVKPGVVIFMTGRAARAGFPVPCPRLEKINGVIVTPGCRQDRGEGFGTGIKFAANEAPIYTARWNLRYYLPDVPTGILPTPPNPFLG